jgi:hypothetical protein
MLADVQRESDQRGARGGDMPRMPAREQTRLPEPSISVTLADTMRAIPREDAGWRLRPPKLDRQPSLLVCMCLAAREAATAPRERSHKKYSPISPDVGMSAV